MSTFSRADRLVTGLSGLVSGAASIVMVALYFVYDGPPPLANVLGRNLITVATFTGFLIFAVGLARLLRAANGGDPGLAGSVATAALRCYIAVTLVSTSLEAGTSLWHPDGSLDPTVDGPLSAANVLLHGPIAKVLIAAFLIALAVATRHAVLPGWARRGSVVVAVVNLAMVPSLFFGMDASFVYAANGWGSVATMGAINMIWFATLGAAILRSRLDGVTAQPLAHAPGA
ncbi:hypothetical protein [Pseudonocardia acaciae]|uniref:hypothetical protein n=1 Tax=Pseudonocardia acaciae TaxID=551276 RepID=UPI00048DC813